MVADKKGGERLWWVRLEMVVELGGDMREWERDEEAIDREERGGSILYCITSNCVGEDGG